MKLQIVIESWLIRYDVRLLHCEMVSQKIFNYVIVIAI